MLPPRLKGQASLTALALPQVSASFWAVVRWGMEASWRWEGSFLSCSEASDPWEGITLQEGVCPCACVVLSLSLFPDD